MAAPASDFLNEKTLYFTTENFTLLQKTLLYYRKFYYTKSIFSTKLVSIKIPFTIRKSTICFFTYFDINWCTTVWIKHKRNIFKWFAKWFYWWLKFLNVVNTFHVVKFSVV